MRRESLFCLKVVNASSLSVAFHQKAKAEWRKRRGAAQTDSEFMVSLLNAFCYTQVNHHQMNNAYMYNLHLLKILPASHNYQH